jgi:Ca2+/Na+ antiporter
MAAEPNDLINGLFEFVGGILVFLNCYRLYIDKEVKGVSLYACLYFTAWGLWNCYFYPVLGLSISFIGALVITIANILWVSLAIYYTRKIENER